MGSCLTGVTAVVRKPAHVADLEDRVADLEARILSMEQLWVGHDDRISEAEDCDDVHYKDIRHLEDRVHALEIERPGGPDGC